MFVRPRCYRSFVSDTTRERIALHLPDEISGLIRGGAFPLDSSNPIVVFESRDGSESLFDTRKGLFLSPPDGFELPARESLKAFGKLIANFRKMEFARSEPSGTQAEEAMINRFEVCC